MFDDPAQRKTFLVQFRIIGIVMLLLGLLDYGASIGENYIIGMYADLVLFLHFILFHLNKAFYHS